LAPPAPTPVVFGEAHRRGAPTLPLPPPVVFGEAQRRGSPSSPGPRTVFGSSAGGNPAPLMQAGAFAEPSATLRAAVPSADVAEEDEEDYPALMPIFAEPSATPRAAVLSADVAEQDYPTAPEAPVTSEVPTVENNEGSRQCFTCHRRFPLADFVGVSGERTTRTCHECCVWIRDSLPSASMAADRLLASPTGPSSGPSSGRHCTGRGTQHPGSPGRRQPTPMPPLPPTSPSGRPYRGRRTRHADMW
jgi:hypothetical protein